MIGQTLLINRIKTLIDEDNFPRFSIISGAKGSGKKMLVHLIADMMEVKCIEAEDVKIDTIRNIIELSHHCTDKVIYLLPDADSMSINAKNSILKITEEPPQNAYFIMTLEDEAQTLTTIRSRAQIFRMLPYTSSEIYTYANSVSALDKEALDIVVDVVETPRECDLLIKYGAIAFRDYVYSVVDNVAEVSGANSFKIADKISMKDGDEKFDLRLFWKQFILECLHRQLETDNLDSILKYSRGVHITSKYAQELSITGINKQMTFDNWLLDIRSEWRNYE